MATRCSSSRAITTRPCASTPASRSATSVESEWIHETIDGRRYWLIHGDEYDQVTRHHRWVAVLGDVAYNALVRLNLMLSRVRRLLRIPGYWSLAGYAKQKVKRAVSFIFDFEDAVAHAAQQRGVDGVICGHIHWAADRRIGNVRYLNCGDWVDTCSAVVEHYDGRIEVLQWGVQAVPQARPDEPGVSVPAAQPAEPATAAKSVLELERVYLTPDV